MAGGADRKIVLCNCAWVLVAAWRAIPVYRKHEIRAATRQMEEAWKWQSAVSAGMAYS